VPGSATVVSPSDCIRQWRRARPERAVDVSDRVPSCRSTPAHVNEDAGWISSASRTMRPTGGIGRRLANAGKLHGFGIRENRVTVQARERNGSIRDRGAKRLVRGKCFPRPQILIPTVAENPRIRRGLGERDGLRDDICVRMQLEQIDLRQIESNRGEVEMRVDQAGQHRVPGEVEHLRLRPRSAIAPSREPT